MARWDRFAREAPELAESGHKLIYQFGPGLGFLGTVGPDGGPRVHPICPLVANGGLYAFLVPSPKRLDLERNGRFALHSFPAEETDDEFYVTGTAIEVRDDKVREEVADAYHDEVRDEWKLFHFDVEVALHAAYRWRGDWPPVYTKWRDRASSESSEH